jgi:hypothetical protein
MSPGGAGLDEVEWLHPSHLGVDMLLAFKFGLLSIVICYLLAIVVFTKFTNLMSNEAGSYTWKLLGISARESTRRSTIAWSEICGMHEL